MATTLDTLLRDAPIPTWFGVGGRASRLAKPRTVDELATLLAIDPNLRILGDGANLLVDDDGIDDLVVSLDSPNTSFTQATIRDDGLVEAGAGFHLFKLMNQTVRAGLAGLEVLAGVPARLGGAIVMNAGGAYGQIADVVERVHALDRNGNRVTLERKEIDFSYRHSGLNHLIITSADLRLKPAEVSALELRKKQINDAKAASQPMNAHSAGCCFKNPTLTIDLTHRGQLLGTKGQRVSAGMLIDRAGCKGLRHGTATVSTQHANFLTIDSKATGKARDVIELMREVQRRVLDVLGVQLHREVVVWSRHTEHSE
jgi:UDP-N-acetylmuramate dehydrogenase